MSKKNGIDRIIGVSFDSITHGRVITREYNNDDYDNCSSCVFYCGNLDCAENNCEAIHRKDKKSVYFDKTKDSDKIDDISKDGDDELVWSQSNDYSSYNVYYNGIGYDPYEDYYD